MTKESGVKYDGDKIDWSLLPVDEVEDIVKVLMHGAKKYPSADNWKRLGDSRRRYYNAAKRHLEAWWRGQIRDSDSGLPHMAHIGCCILFLAWFDKHGYPGDNPWITPKLIRSKK